MIFVTPLNCYHLFSFFNDTTVSYFNLHTDIFDRLSKKREEEEEEENTTTFCLKCIVIA